jgi:hypothetical protein
LIAFAVVIALLVPILISSIITSAKAHIIIVSVATIVCITILAMAVQVRTIEVIVAGTT